LTTRSARKQRLFSLFFFNFSFVKKYPAPYKKDAGRFTVLVTVCYFINTPPRSDCIRGWAGKAYWPAVGLEWITHSGS